MYLKSLGWIFVFFLAIPISSCSSNDSSILNSKGLQQLPALNQTKNTQSKQVATLEHQEKSTSSSASLLRGPPNHVNDDGSSVSNFIRKTGSHGGAGGTSLTRPSPQSRNRASNSLVPIVSSCYIAVIFACVQSFTVLIFTF